MQKDDAEIQADRLVELVLTHQQQLFASHTPTATKGTDIGLAIAALRKTLIEELQKQ